MGQLTILQQVRTSFDGTAVQADDATQMRLVGEEWGWGMGDAPVNRSERTLLFWMKHINARHVASYLAQNTSFGKYAIAPGAGLTNYDMSSFVVATPDDGHYLSYMLPLRYLSTQVGDTGELAYHNSDDGQVYVYDNEWKVLTEAEFPLLEASSLTSLCENLFACRKLIVKNILCEQAYLDPSGRINEKKQNLYLQLKAELNMAFAAFSENKKAVARERLNNTLRFAKDCTL